MGQHGDNNRDDNSHKRIRDKDSKDDTQKGE